MARVEAGRVRWNPTPPCAKCGTTGGKTPPGSGNAVRASGRHLGVDGFLCSACYERLYRLHYQRQPNPKPMPKMNPRSARRRRDRLDVLDEEPDDA